MSYIDWEYFQDYAPNTLNEALFDEWIGRASDVIDMLTFCRIKKAGGIGALSEHCAEAVRKATAAQLLTLATTGGEMMSSVSLGKFSYSNSGASNSDSIYGIPLSGLVRGYLACCPGLTYTGLRARCR